MVVRHIGTDDTFPAFPSWQDVGASDAANVEVECALRRNGESKAERFDAGLPIPCLWLIECERRLAMISMGGPMLLCRCWPWLKLTSSAWTVGKSDEKKLETELNTDSSAATGSESVTEDDGMTDMCVCRSNNVERVVMMAMMLQSCRARDS